MHTLYPHAPIQLLVPQLIRYGLLTGSAQQPGYQEGMGTWSTGKLHGAAWKPRFWRSQDDHPATIQRPQQLFRSSQGHSLSTKTAFESLPNVLITLNWDMTLLARNAEHHIS